MLTNFITRAQWTYPNNNGKFAKRSKLELSVTLVHVRHKINVNGPVMAVRRLSLLNRSKNVFVHLDVGYREVYFCRRLRSDACGLARAPNPTLALLK